MTRRKRLAVKVSNVAHLDIPALLDMERQAGVHVDEEREVALRSLLRIPEVSGFMASRDEHVLGYTLYCVNDRNIHLVSIIVHPNFRQQSVGTQLVARVVEVFERSESLFLWTRVDRSNLAAWGLFESQNFLALLALQGQGGSPVVMERRKNPEYCLVNRIAQYLK